VAKTILAILFWLLIKAKHLCVGLSDKGFEANKYYPQGGDLFVQTRRAWPFLTRRYKFAVEKAKRKLTL